MVKSARAPDDDGLGDEGRQHESGKEGCGGLSAVEVRKSDKDKDKTFPRVPST